MRSATYFLSWIAQLSLVVVGAIWLVLIFVTPASAYDASDIERHTNQHRTAAGLPELQSSEQLTASAAAKAQHMIDSDYWAHDAPDGTQPWAFIREADYDYSAAGENLARNFSGAEQVIEAWMNSPSHRDNIEDPRFRDIGVAVVASEEREDDDRIIVVVHYGVAHTSSVKDRISRVDVRNYASNTWAYMTRLVGMGRIL